MRIQLEQTPDAANRVFLADETDVLGRRLPRLAWRVTGEDRFEEVLRNIEHLAAQRRCLTDHPAGVAFALPWLVPRIRRCAATYEDIDGFFDRIWDQVDRVGEDRGCLVVNTATELRAREPALIEVGARHREFLRAGFTTALERAVELGQLERDRVADQANLLVAATLGLAVMIRGGASPAEVRDHIESAKGSLRRT